MPSAKLKEDMGRRLKEARERLGETQKDLCARIGMPLPSLRDYELGNRIPGGEALVALMRAGINANWLLTGEGPMLLAELQRQGGPELEASRAEVAELHDRLDKLSEERAPRVEVLRKVVTMLEEELELADMDLTPDGKAKVIAILYEYAVKAGALDAPMLRSVLSLAA